MERGLIDWFEALMARCERDITPETAGRWAEILAAPMEIRGFGPVKHAAAGATRARVEALIGSAARPAGRTKVAVSTAD